MNEKELINQKVGKIMSKTEAFQSKIQLAASKIQMNRYLNAITNGLMSLLPVTIVGAVGSLINSVDIDSYQNFLVKSGLKIITSAPAEMTTNLMALYAVFMIAVKLADSFEVDGPTAGLLSLMGFLLVTPFVSPEGEFTMASLNVGYFGARGLFTAFIVAIVVTRIYVLFTANGWVLKMPASVPPAISKSFSALVPSMIILVLMSVVRYLFQLTSHGNIHEFIYQLIAQPLMSLGVSFPTTILAIILVSILWFFGIHGGLIIYTVFAPIWASIAQENIAAFNAGRAIPHILSGSFYQQATVMGSGATLGLTIAMLFAKSKQYKALGRLTIIPNLCGINEPVIFGTPIIMNVRFLIPFILTPVVVIVSAYAATLLKILPVLPGVSTPLGTPVLVSGFIASGGDWRWVIFQLLMIVVSFLMYYPFLRIADKEALRVEQESEVAAA